MTLYRKEFEEIRPYNNDEVNGVINQLLTEPFFKEALGRLNPNVPFEQIANMLKDVHTVDDFQVKIMYDTLSKLAKKTTVSLECSGLDHLDKHMSYSFISNHRDIVLDAAWLNLLLHQHDFPTTEVAIGDNLFVFDWIKAVTRLNKSFIVKRGISPRQMLTSSAILSSYIHYAICEKKNSIWIAQREGRAKDSNDRTQESLLKMLGMSGSNYRESMRTLNIVPLSLSYELDPCDYLKAKEYQLKRDNAEYKKSKEDDFLNMKTGIEGFKGRVHFRAGICINGFIEALPQEMTKAEFVTALAQEIDREIHANYHIYPCNYIAYDMLLGIKRFGNRYSEKEENTFIDYLKQQIDKIQIENKDVPFLRKKMLEMYSNPLRNKLEATNQGI